MTYPMLTNNYLSKHQQDQLIAIVSGIKFGRLEGSFVAPATSTLVNYLQQQGFIFNECIVNKYTDGGYLELHRDNQALVDPIRVLSLGSSGTMIIDGNEIRLDPGSFLKFSKTQLHGIKSVEGLRYSIVLRKYNL